MNDQSLFNPNDAREFMRRANAGELPPLIISAAITGGSHGKEVCAALPETPQEQAEESRRCWEAGAAAVHIHARDPSYGYARAARRTEDYVLVNRAIRELCPDIIINNTSGGGVGLELQDRLCSLDAGPEVSDIDMGPFASRTKLKKRERPLTGRDEDQVLDRIASFTIGETEERARRMQQRGIRPEMALFHSGHWSTVFNLIDRGLVAPPYNFYFLFGLTTGALPTMASLLEMLQPMPAQSTVMVGAIGRAEFHMTAAAILLGLNVSIGLENNLYDPSGKKVDSNARAVERVVRLAEQLGRKIATPAQARAMLGISEKPSAYPAA